MELNFKNYIECDKIIEEAARQAVEDNVDPRAIQELADIFNEFNAFRTLGGVGGAMAGSVLGLPGQIGGAMAGTKAGDALGNWLAKKTGFVKTQQITPAYSEAKTAFTNLVTALGKQRNNPIAQKIMASKDVQEMIQSVNEMGRFVPMVDGELKTGTKQTFLGKARDMLADWAQRHPLLSRGLDLGGSIGMAMAAGQMMHGMGHGATATHQPVPGHAVVGGTHGHGAFHQAFHNPAQHDHLHNTMAAHGHPMAQSVGHPAPAANWDIGKYAAPAAAVGGLGTSAYMMGKALAPNQRKR